MTAEEITAAVEVWAVDHEEDYSVWQNIRAILGCSS